MPVDWKNSLIVEKKSSSCTSEGVHESHRLWVDLCRPSTMAHLYGNDGPKQQLRQWLRSRLSCGGGNACLVVTGPSGIGKSTAVDLCAKEEGFHVEHTFANVSRTPAKLESIQRRSTMHAEQTVLVLDDFESFIYETASMRDILKFARGADNTQNQAIIVICNGMDKMFQPLFANSTVVEFETPTSADVQTALRRVAKVVSPFATIPPMDIFFIAHGSMGNICQTINQVQLSHNRRHTGKTRKQRGKLTSQAQTDSLLHNWATTHRSSSIDCFANTSESVVGYIWAMSKDFHLDARDNLHCEYPLYFHNSTPSTLDQMWLVADNVSACDVYAPDEADSLYDTENRECWGRDNLFAVAHISCGLWGIQGRQRGVNAPKKRRIKKKFSYV